MKRTENKSYSRPTLYISRETVMSLIYANGTYSVLNKSH